MTMRVMSTSCFGVSSMYIVRAIAFATFVAAIMIIEQKFDDVAFANRRGRLHALSVDLDVTAATSVGGIATLLEKADQFEPVIDSMSFHL